MSGLLAFFLVGLQPIHLNRLPAIHHRFVVICNRGNHMAAPENTLSALAAAIDLDTEYVQADVRTSNDGQPVVIKDATVDRTTDGKGKVSDLKLAELAQLHVKLLGHPDEHIPSLNEFLNAAKGGINVYLDILDADPGLVLASIEGSGMDPDVVVHVHTTDQIDLWRKKAPRIPLAFDLSPDMAKSPDNFDAAWRAHPFEVLDGPGNMFTKELVSRAHKLGVKVWPDVHSQFETMATWTQIVATGVDGLRTDQPQTLTGFLAIHSMR
jgi:glycerophosphoryl diester phosphodiesterase